MKTKLVAKAVLVNGQDILLLRRSKTDKRRPLEWDLPGGMVEEGEEFGKATAREVQEETGLVVAPGHLDAVFTKTEIRNDINVIFVFFAAKSEHREVQLSFEHDRYEWMPLKRAIVEMQYYLHRELLQYIDRYSLFDVL